MVTVVPGAHDGDMIWWVLASGIFVIIGLAYVMSHESDFCAAKPDQRSNPDRSMNDAAPSRRKAA